VFGPSIIAHRSFPLCPADATRPIVRFLLKRILTFGANTFDMCHDSKACADRVTGAGAQAGIGVACGIVGLVAIAVVVVLLINRRRKRQRTGDWVSDDWNRSSVLRKYESPDLQQPQELPAQCQVELPAGILSGGTELESSLTLPKK
jgi:hypothetical protein